MTPTLTADEKRQRANALNWFHSIDLGHGVVTSGVKNPVVLKTEANVVFKHGVTGLSVLDVGAWDGYFSFEAKKRGASRVRATDYYCWSGPGWGTKAGFDLARQCLGLDIEDVDMDITQPGVKELGTFDMVLFLGVLYHLKNPLAVIEALAEITRKMMVVETHLDAMTIDRPAMIFYPGSELNNDGSNWWGPNARCVIDMLKVAGFSRVEYNVHPLGSDRGFFHAFRDA